MKSTRYSATVIVLLVFTTSAFLIGCSRDPNVKKQKYMESGKRYMEQAKYREASIQFSNVLQIDPRSADAHYQLARSYMQQQQFSPAYSEFLRAVDLAPNNIEARQALGMLLFAGKKNDEALEQAHAILQQDPKNADAHALIANVDIALGKNDSALDEIQNAIRSNPSNAYFLTIQATLQMAAKQSAAAEASLKKAIELEPKNPQYRLSLARFYEAVQQLPQAEQEYHQAIESNPKDVDTRIAFARYLLIHKRQEEAEQVAKDAKATLGPTNPRANQLLGNLYLGLGESDKALAEFASLYQQHPKDKSLRDQYVDLLIRANRLDDAAKLNAESLKENNKDVTALLNQANIDLRRDTPPSTVAQTLDTVLKTEPDNALAHFLRGFAAERSGDSDRAGTEFRQAAQLNPSLLQAQEGVSRIAIQKADVDGLFKAAEQILSLQPNQPEGYVLRALAESNRQQMQKAEQDLQTAIKVAPQSALGYLNLGKLRLGQKKYPEAEKNFELALDRDSNSSDAMENLLGTYVIQHQPLTKIIARINAQIAKAPNNSQFYFMLGTAQSRNHDLPAAEQSLQKALQLDGNNAGALSLLGQVLVEQGETDKAIANWSSYVQRDPNNPQGYVTLGTLEASRGNWQKGQELYQKALNIRPDYPVAANNLAYSLLEHGGNPDLALSLAQTAKRALPASSDMTDTVGWAYYYKGVYSLAADMLNEAITKNPNSAVYHYHLGMTYLKQNDSAKAKQHLQKSLELDPKFEDADSAKKALEQIKG